ncbi:30S ribosomal protein S24e [Methanofollis fontis]|uniref:Small ribosomal subunit protein eS24 n=1 Tax=Methanofollis fontis TaxID=2052832 RepID=A0A483CRA8_9EURY|nr:30S ribosomal protein S24e [Methanofollis fontis]TAJ45643.1 30S ribosomal protein S24e [Methanofollis fontis]
MEFEITRDNRNELLNRREVHYTLTYDGATPSRVQILGKLAALMNAPENLVVLDSMKKRFGAMEVEGVARIYDNEDALKMTEREYLVKRSAPAAKEAE